jgi:hypothetical protein
MFSARVGRARIAPAAESGAESRIPRPGMRRRSLRGPARRPRDRYRIQSWTGSWCHGPCRASVRCFRALTDALVDRFLLVVVDHRDTSAPCDVRQDFGKDGAFRQPDREVPVLGTERLRAQVSAFGEDRMQGRLPAPSRGDASGVAECVVREGLVVGFAAAEESQVSGV